MTEEIWEDVKDWGTYYQVSSFGRVRSKPRKKPKKSKKGFWLSPEKILSIDTSSTFLRVTFCIKGRMIKYNVCDLVAQAFIPNPESLPYVYHIDRDKNNNHVSNLRWCAVYNEPNEIDGEVWKPLRGYEEYYEVSSLGRVKSLPKDKVAYTTRTRILKPTLNKRCGYLYVGIFNGVKSCTKRLHKLIATTFIPNPNNYPTINHKNGIKTDNRVSNLEWCTQLDNNLHALEMGLMTVPAPRRGEENWNAKLKASDIPEIRSSLLTVKELAEKYNVTQQAIWAIKKFKTWKHI